MALSGFPDRSRIEADQLGKLRALLGILLGANAFYSTKLSAAGVGADLASLEEYFERWPFTQKRELTQDQREHPPYGTNLTYPLERYTRFCHTSATSGRPMHWLDTPQSWAWMVDNWTEVFRASGVTSQDRIFFAFSFGPFLGFWTAFEAALRMGCLSIPGGGMRSSARLQAIVDTGATVLCCTPTYSIRLAEVAAEQNFDLKDARIKKIFVAGETGGSIPGTVAHIEKLWHGARIVDQHGMTETGPVSYSCSVRPGVLHVMESAYIAEIISTDTGRPVPPGGTGELVLTNLGRTGSPILRYRTGDLVQRAAECPCACGRHDLALEGGILGRTDDMVVVRGVNVYPSAVEDVLRSFGVAEYRVEIRTERALPELSIQVEPSPGQQDGAGLAHQLEAALNNAFSLRIPVSCVHLGELPRFEMKARRWVRV
ncbi:MAG: AMP-binding protein [Acidobacteriia bacterium]|nr:AMP-binding protein [Terriglobia bacterium]